MSLPTSRNTTYVAGVSQVKAADLNDVQDTIIAGGHGDMIKAVPFAAWVFNGDGDGTYSVSQGALSLTSATSFFLGPQFDVGDRIKSMSVMLLGDGSADVTFTVYKIETDGTKTSLGALTVTDAASSPWSDHPLDFTDVTLADGESIFVHAVPTAGGLKIGTTRFSYDHP